MKTALHLVEHLKPGDMKEGNLPIKICNKMAKKALYQERVRRTTAGLLEGVALIMQSNPTIQREDKQQEKELTQNVAQVAHTSWSRAWAKKPTKG